MNEDNELCPECKLQMELQENLKYKWYLCRMCGYTTCPEPIKFSKPITMEEASIEEETGMINLSRPNPSPTQPAGSITKFQGEYRWLSNFWPVPIKYKNYTFPSVEHAYQASKTYERNYQHFLNCTASQAKSRGRTFEMDPTWNKIACMRELLALKFAPNSPLADQLLSTGNAELIEGNTWNDTFWGVCQGKGQNMLGKLLMQRRWQLRQFRNQTYDQ